MATLALVSQWERRNSQRVKLILSILAVSFSVLSCTPVHERQAGGGAFDDSEVGKALDANAPLPQDNINAARSFEEWRERE